MISHIHRFHGHNSLDYVYRTGRSLRSEFVVLKTAPSKKTDYRLAVVVSKKVSKSAVVRNRIRRRIYEIVRKERKNNELPWPNDMIISVFDEQIATMPTDQLQETIIKLLEKAGVLSRST